MTSDHLTVTGIYRRDTSHDVGPIMGANIREKKKPKNGKKSPKSKDVSSSSYSNHPISNRKITKSKKRSQRREGTLLELGDDNKVSLNS